MIDYKQFHPEDVKAAIRKRFGSLRKFEETHGLARMSVQDMLRGRTSARTAKVVNAVLVIESVSTGPSLSTIKDATSNPRALHRQFAKVA